MADEMTITTSLATAGHTDKRRRVLTGLVTVTAILGLCLFRRDGSNLVIARVLPTSRRQILRRRATDRPSAVRRPDPATPDRHAGGLHAHRRSRRAGRGSRLTRYWAAGHRIRRHSHRPVRDRRRQAVEFATQSGGRSPQARLVTLVACGARWIIAAAQGSSALSEQHLVDTLADTLQPGTLNFADRNFFSMTSLDPVRPDRRAPGLAGQERQQKPAHTDHRHPLRRLRTATTPRIRQHARLPAGQDREQETDPATGHHRPPRRVHRYRHRRGR